MVRSKISNMKHVLYGQTQGKKTTQYLNSIRKLKESRCAVMEPIFVELYQLSTLRKNDQI